MKDIVILATLVLLSQAVIRDDLMTKVPVSIRSYRAMVTSLREPYTPGISTQPTLLENCTTYLLSPSTDLITKIQSHCGWMEVQAARPY